MPADVTDEAIVLRRSDSGETDRRLTLITRSHGKLDVIAKGARKAGSRLAGSSEPLSRALFTWASGRVRRFVTQVQPLTSYPGLRADYDKTLAALALAELVAVGSPYESQGGHTDLFELFRDSLGRLEEAPDWKPTFLWAEVRLLSEEGVQPDWTVCALTGSALKENPAWLSPSAGGYVVSRVAAGFPDRLRVSAEALLTLKKLGGREEPPQQVLTANECLQVMLAFWRHVLESRLPANEALVAEATR